MMMMMMKFHLSLCLQVEDFSKFLLTDLMKRLEVLKDDFTEHDRCHLSAELVVPTYKIMSVGASFVIHV